jgi:hypothetical protein
LLSYLQDMFSLKETVKYGIKKEDNIENPTIIIIQRKLTYADSGYGNLHLAHAYVRPVMFTRSVPIPGVLCEQVRSQLILRLPRMRHA